MRAAFVLILTGVLLTQGCQSAPDASRARQKELAGILKPLLKPAVPSFWSDGHEEPPGWYSSANRQGLRNFIAKYPGTEDAYQAEIWLAFADTDTEKCPIAADEKGRIAGLAERLEIISQKTGRPGT